MVHTYDTKTACEYLGYWVDTGDMRIALENISDSELDIHIWWSDESPWAKELISALALLLYPMFEKESRYYGLCPDEVCQDIAVWAYKLHLEVLEAVLQRSAILSVGPTVL